MSESQRKYQRVEGWWVYVVKTPDNMYYPGYSGGKDGKKQCRHRWCPSHYHNTALEPYIEQYGWENLEKIVVKDGLTEDEAVKWEGVLINMYCSIGCCINQQRSGNRTKNNDYKHLTYLEHRDEYIARTTKYREKHQDEIKIKKHIYYEYNKEEIKSKSKKYYQQHKQQYSQQPEKKVYKRVANYNRYHTPIETPLEAKKKFLETGYIPSYIKSDDLV